MWFGDLELLSLTEETATFKTPTMLRKQILTTKYYDILKGALDDVIGFNVNIEIVYPEDNSKNLQNTEVFSFSDTVPTSMAAADLFVTKPGGISSTEAAVSGLPTIVMNVIGACETPNYNFFVDHNYFYGATTIDDVCNYCSTPLSDDNELKARSNKLKEAFDHNAAADIYKAMGEK